MRGGGLFYGRAGMRGSVVGNRTFLGFGAGGFLVFFQAVFLAGACGASTEYAEGDSRRLKAVRSFAENVLEKGRDRWSGQETPLLADGINVDTGSPVVWRYEGKEYIIHNLANQQNLFRVLVGLSNLTGDERYKAAAKASIRYHFDNLAAGCGKLRWGGHQFIDLRTLSAVGHFDANCHEFKCNFPYYELMWEVGEEATATFIRALWQGHVSNWRDLTMNRHAGYRGGPAATSAIWERAYDDPAPFFEANGLSFLNCGSDLIYAGGMLFALNGERGSLEWALRMAGMYAKARHPETGMGAYQYTKPRRSTEPPEGPLTGTLTYSSYGDRTENQFGRSGSSDPGHEYYNPVKDKTGPDGMLVAREGWMASPGGYPWYAIVQLHLAETLGSAGQAFADDAANHLEAYARHSYRPHENHFLAMWADGTDATGLKIPRTGYHGQQGVVFRAKGVDQRDLLAYVRAYRVTGRSFLWETARSMARGLGMGEIGSRPGVEVSLEPGSAGSDYREVFVLLEMHRASDHPAYLAQARLAGDRIVKNRFHNGLFVADQTYINASFDAVEPLALLALEAVLRGEPDKAAPYVGGRGYIHGQFDGYGRTYDNRAIWSQRRSGSN